MKPLHLRAPLRLTGLHGPITLSSNSLSLSLPVLYTVESGRLWRRNCEAAGSRPAIRLRIAASMPSLTESHDLRRMRTKPRVGLGAAQWAGTGEVRIPRPGVRVLRRRLSELRLVCIIPQTAHLWDYNMSP
jgi:hypothetical protein